jgi:tetratricopeptide (TPR) repeat protein
LLLVVPVALAYANTLSCPFILDDPHILGLLKSRWHVAPMEYLCLGRRTLFNLSMMLNYALGGEDPRGYHVLNLAIHLAATLSLFGLVRQTLLTPRLRDRWGASSRPVALAVALLWGLHPLCTESVTYTVQRAEAMYGLFTFLAGYCLVRSALAGTRRGDLGWQAGCLLACGLGMLSKEAMIATLPLLPLYDRIFLASSWRETLRRRSPLFGGILLFGVLPAVVLGMAQSLGSAAFDADGISSWEYFLTQGRAILRYLHLAFWPDNLCFNYGWPTVDGPGEVWLELVVVGILGMATALALWKRPAIGFLGAWFFVHLAPRSSFAPRPDICVEHRMYVPLAAIVALTVCGAWAWAAAPAATTRRRWLLIGTCVVALALGVRTFRRNRDYRSVLSIWEDAVRTSPDSPRGRVSLAFALAEAGKHEAAMEQLRHALRLNPDYSEAHYQLAASYAAAGQTDLALHHYEVAATTGPKTQAALAWNNRSCLLNDLGRFTEAEEGFRRAVKLQPRHAEAWINLAGCLTRQDRIDEAMAVFDQAQALAPDDPDLWSNRGAALLQRGDAEPARTAFGRALALDPDHSHARFNLGTYHENRGETDAAKAAYERAAALDAKFADPRLQLAAIATASGQPAVAERLLRETLAINPNHPGARNDLACLLSAEKRHEEALTEFRRLVADHPQEVQFWYNFASAWDDAGNLAEAENAYRHALKLDPAHADTANNLGCLLARQGKFREAAREFRSGLVHDPDSPVLQQNLRLALQRLEKPAPTAAPPSPQK